MASRRGAPVAHRARRQRRSVASLLAGGLLNVLAAGGVLCVALVVLGVVFDITLIMFKTGSMSPTIPTGSLAVVREVPASSIAVGDVVTVGRPGELPVTHRVTSVSDGAVEPGATRVITMRGDANETDDPAPYSVSSVRSVLWSVPHLAYTVQWFSNPVVLGSITAGAAALVTWAFWPRRAGARDVGVEASAPRRHRDSRARLGGSTVVVLGLATGLALATPQTNAMATAASVPAAGASAAPGSVSVARISGEFLTLTTVSDRRAMTNMDVGASVVWTVGVEAAPPHPVPVTFGVALESSQPGVFSHLIEACSRQWEDDACSGERVVLQPEAPVVSSEVEVLGVMSSNEERWLRVVVSRNATGHENGVRADVEIHAWAEGDRVGVGSGSAGQDPEQDGAGGSPGGGGGGSGDLGSASGGSLAWTGADPRFGALLAFGAITAGLGVAAVATVLRKRAPRRDR
ncbi:signal peptidase I [Marisediminicola sp. LYQ134]|uniref:signal peptidase I n=1 Tax=Marisediminicola sp. LYQ134 TaxID=3391061 RepID=UPI0039833A69